MRYPKGGCEVLVEDVVISEQYSALVFEQRVLWQYKVLYTVRTTASKLTMGYHVTLSAFRITSHHKNDTVNEKGDGE